MQSDSRLRVLGSASLLLAGLTLVSCGGGGAGETDAPSREAAAATATAQSNPLCSVATLGSYYWEIGDRDGVLVSGSMGSAGITADTEMNIASASKWLFAGYVLEKYGDPTRLVPFLNFTSGYSNLNNDLCTATGTVAECMNGGINASEAASGMFHYQGGHMQQLAINLGLGAMRNDALAGEVRAQIGTDVALQYIEPLPPGGVRTNAANYATFLRRLLIDSPTPLRLGSALGTHAVCTQPSPTCNASTDTAAALPENFHYSLGHWVEDDPTHTPSSNFAYSSAGKFGFYPWVDFDRKLYGIIARDAPTSEASGEGYASLECGRLIRLAWKTGVPQ